MAGSISCEHENHTSNFLNGWAGWSLRPLREVVPSAQTEDSILGVKVMSIAEQQNEKGRAVTARPKRDCL